MLPEFVAFTKIPRLNRDIVITEKIDGSNGVIYIDVAAGIVQAGSRSRWVSPGKQDNFGFAAWVAGRAEDLAAVLGDGWHHGEWYGCGIQRGYGLDEKRFALFNPKWRSVMDTRGWLVGLDVVPVLYDGPFNHRQVDYALLQLSLNGSQAVPGFMEPEGVVIFHTASRHLYKYTIRGDEKPKGSQE